ncbi:LytTR family transcriptional regulator DNA-binding domain-containing protein [Phocaeicola plebeius]|uniref:LytTR family transcriptional regulator DNA-binding domain-containing protein n=1 Tax=Phocaeicola plebeius TaxID=310297 RepID=UPI00350E3A93
MGNLRVLHSNHIGYFKYISTKKSWEIALTDGAFVRLKGNLRAKNLCAYNDRFIQIHQSYIINIQYLCMIQNNHCIMYPPFHHIDELCISQKYKKALTTYFYQL